LAVIIMTTLSFKVKSLLRKRRWKKYWIEQDARNHIEYFRKLSQEWKAR